MPKFSVGDVCYSHIKRIFQHAIPDGFDTEEWNSTVVKGVVVPGGTKKKVLVRWDIKGTPVEREHGAGFLRKTPEECKVAVKPTKLMMDATQGRKIGEKHLEAGMNVNCIARNVFNRIYNDSRYSCRGSVRRFFPMDANTGDENRCRCLW